MRRVSKHPPPSSNVGKRVKLAGASTHEFSWSLIFLEGEVKSNMVRFRVQELFGTNVKSKRSKFTGQRMIYQEVHVNSDSESYGLTG